MMSPSNKLHSRILIGILDVVSILLNGIMLWLLWFGISMSASGGGSPDLDLTSLLLVDAVLAIIGIILSQWKRSYIWVLMSMALPMVFILLFLFILKSISF